MKVPDLPTLNGILAGCGCCTLPTCADASVRCESLTRTASASDDDYSDAVAVWNAANNLRNAWEADHASFPTRHAAWAACTENCGDEPTDAPAPPMPGTAPVKPEGYDDKTHGSWAPIMKPAGENSADLPSIYRELATVIEVDLVSGTSGHLAISSPESGDIGQDGLYFWYDYSGAEVVTGMLAGGQYHLDPDHAGDPAYEFCGELFSGTGVGYSHEEPSGGVWEVELSDPECTATSQKLPTSKETMVFGSKASQPVCPGPWVESYEEWCDLTRSSGSTKTISSAVGKEAVKTRAVGKIPAWPEISEGTSCTAKLEYVWPKIGDFTWPGCSSSLLPLEANGQVTAVRIRYKMGVPTGYMAHRLWVTTHAAWVPTHASWVTTHEAWVTAGSTPGSEPTEPPEPAEPQTYQYFAVQWDMVQFPKAWEEWRVLFDAWTDAKALKETWDACEILTPGDCGVAPTVPPDPSVNQPTPRPSFFAENLFWEWTGGETEVSQYSGWREVAVPAEEGQTRMVNKMVKCWQSLRTGVPSTAHGEIYNPDDYPA